MNVLFDRNETTLSPDLTGRRRQRQQQLKKNYLRNVESFGWYLQFFLAIDFDQLRFEDERRATGNFVTSTGAAIAQLWRNDQATLLAFAHAQQSLVPALNHLTRAQCERQWLTAWNAAVELEAIFQSTL